MINGQNKHFIKFYTLFAISLLLILFLFASCDLGDEMPDQSQFGEIYVQVVNINYSGPIPDGWTPQPIRQVKTIIVTNETKDVFSEIKTDSTGSVRIWTLVKGTYYFGVKESPLQILVGPINWIGKGDIHVNVF
jgi:hypothetical protein